MYVKYISNLQSNSVRDFLDLTKVTTYVYLISKISIYNAYVIYVIMTSFSKKIFTNWSIFLFMT